MKTQPTTATAGMTFSEVLVAILLMAIFCGSVFELNAVCLRYIDSSKEAVAALQAVHDRAEALRNLSFSDLTTSATVQSLLAAAPANSSDFCKKATETVNIATYPAGGGTMTFVRTPDGTVTPSSNGSVGTTLVQVDVSTSWSMLGGRQISEQTSTIISNGTKK